MLGVTSSVARTSLAVHLYVTPVCNLSCPHCYYDALERVTPPRPEISLEAIAQLLCTLAERFEPDVHLEGGEPFLRPGIGSVLESLPPEVLRCITVTTNGTVAIPVSPRVLSSLGGLRVSIDGHTDDLQHELRGTVLRPVLRTCRRLNEAQVPFVVRMTLWRRNIASLDDIYAFADRYGIRHLSLFEFQPVGRAVGTELLYGVTDQAFDAFLHDLQSTTPPDSIETIRLSIAERRVSTVQKAADGLAEQGFALATLPDVASCTINYDGSVGIGAWDVTAKGATDVFTDTTVDTFFDVLQNAAAAGALADDSPFTTRLQVRRPQ